MLSTALRPPLRVAPAERGAAWSSFGLNRSPTRSRRSATARSQSAAAPISSRCSATGSSTPTRSSSCGNAVPKGVDGTTIGAGTTLASSRRREIPERCARRAACRRRRSSAPSERSAGTYCRRRAAGTGASSPLPPARRRRCHAREGSTASTRSSRTTSARRRTHPIRLPHCSRSARPFAPIGASCRSQSCTGCHKDDRSTTTLATDELIVELDVPRPDASVYLKAMDRRRWAFALVGVAAARFGDDVRFGLAGVAPIPWAETRRWDTAARGRRTRRRSSTRS